MVYVHVASKLMELEWNGRQNVRWGMIEREVCRLIKDGIFRCS